MIVAQGVQKAYRRLLRKPVPVLRGVSFQARDGAVTGLVGRNGCGKTTTFRLCAGVLPFDSGRIEVDGVDVSSCPDIVRASLSLQPEIRGLKAEMTGRQIIRQNGMLRGQWGRALEREIDAVIEMLEMGEIANRSCRGLSRGEGAKISLARTIIGDPRNVILDEPTNGLDMVAADIVRRLISDLRARGRCVLISSHLFSDITDLCDEVAVLRDGMIAGQGPLPDLVGFDGRGGLLNLIKEEADHVR
jgi:sodium transport system ATP-binding protein